MNVLEKAHPTSLWLLFGVAAFGAFSFASTAEIQSEFFTSVEVGAAMASPKGDAGGLAVPASCPSFEHFPGECAPAAPDLTVNGFTSDITVESGENYRLDWVCNGGSVPSGGINIPWNPSINPDTDMQFQVWSGPAPHLVPYQIDCDNGGSDNLTVTIEEPFVTISASPPLARKGDSVNLTWDSSGVVSGVLGEALEFDGSDDSIDFDSGTGWLANVPAATVSLWVNGDNISSGFHQALVDISIGGGSGSRYELIWKGTGPAGSFRVGGRGDDSDTFESEETTNLFTSNGTWYHVVGVMDYANKDVKIYVDGVLQNTVGSIDDVAPATSNTSPQDAEIGVNAGSTFWYFDGFLDDVRIYERELTQDEVTRIYNHQSILSTGLVGHYTFGSDSISGNTIENIVSPGTNDGTFVGGTPTLQVGIVPTSFGCIINGPIWDPPSPQFPLNGVSGNVTVGPVDGESDFSISCDLSGGTNVQDSVKVRVVPGFFER